MSVGPVCLQQMKLSVRPRIILTLARVCEKRRNALALLSVTVFRRVKFLASGMEEDAPHIWSCSNLSGFPRTLLSAYHLFEELSETGGGVDCGKVNLSSLRQSTRAKVESL